MFKHAFFRGLAASHLLSVTQVPIAQAAMIGTSEVLLAQQSPVDRQQCPGGAGLPNCRA